MADFQSLTAAVEREHTVNQSAIALINGFKTRLDEAIAAAVAANDNADLSAITSLSESLGTDSQALADAIEANT